MLTILKNIPPLATKIGLKPLDESFYDIKDVKTYLEIMFKKMLLSLTIDEIIELPYLDRSIQFQICLDRPREPRHRDVRLHVQRTHVV